MLKINHKLKRHQKTVFRHGNRRLQGSEASAYGQPLLPVNQGLDVMLHPEAPSSEARNQGVFFFSPTFDIGNALLLSPKLFF